MPDLPDEPRKTLGLPAKPKSEDGDYPSRRKPLRGLTATAKHKALVKAPAAPVAKSFSAPTAPVKRSFSASVKPATVSNPTAVHRARPGAEARPEGSARPNVNPRSPGRPRPDAGPRPNTGSRSNFTPRSNAESRPKPKPKPNQNPKAKALSLKAPTVSTSATPLGGVRVSKLLAARGLCSRREADNYIERGWVFVNGERVTELGTRVDADAVVTLNTQARAMQQRQMTILLNKPVGYVSGQPEPGFTPAVTLILPENQMPGTTPLFQPGHLKGLAPAGRLDIDSTGLLVLTQDGRVARQLVGDDSSVDKEYLVRVEGRLDARGLALLNHGLSLDERELRPAKVEWVNDDQLRFVLREGRKRQIRRMCELVGLRVVGLKRVRIGGVMLADLPVGQWRYLRDDESF